METKKYAVSLERLFVIHQKTRELDLIIGEINSLADEFRGRFFIYIPVVSRFKEFRLFLDNFDNSYDPTGIACTNFEFEVSDFIDLANALNQHLVFTMELDTLGDEKYIRDCQILRMLYDNFYQVVSSIRID